MLRPSVANEGTFRLYILPPAKWVSNHQGKRKIKGQYLTSLALLSLLSTLCLAETKKQKAGLYGERHGWELFHIQPALPLLQ